MEQIAFRWEWRTFGPRFPDLEQRLEAFTPVSGPDMTDETYLLLPGTVNTKIRFGLLDVKSLVATNADGLQQWAPVVKQELPVAAEGVPAILEALGLPGTVPAQGEYTFERLTGEIAAAADLTVFPVTKARMRYVIDGCMVEMTRLSSEDRATMTVAVEAEDPAAVSALLTRFGLGGYTNVSYPDGLRSLVEDTPAKFAVVDIGTNSVKFHVGERHPDGTWTRVVDRADLTRLGEGLADTGEIQPEPLERTTRAVVGMVDEARNLGVAAIAIVGTAVFRLAANGSYAAGNLEGRAGVPVEVISGEEESRLAFLAVTQGVGLEPGARQAVFDTGGGSTEFTFGEADHVTDRFSLPVGSVTLTDRFGLAGSVSAETLEQVQAALGADLERLDGRDTPDVVVGMGGAVTNLTAVSLAMASYDPDAIQGAVLDVAEIDRQIASYASMDETDRRSIVGLQPNRAPVILAGALIVRSVLAKLGAGQLVVSDRGLRHALIRERFGAG